jgi:hypothetical protein
MVIGKGKRKFLVKKKEACPSAIFSTTDPTWATLGFNPGPRCENKMKANKFQ